MQCASCGTALLPGKRFCHACGAPAGVNCPSCGATVEPDFRFCPDCGAALSGEAPGTRRPASDENGSVRGPTPPPRPTPHERKLVTVLFCDLVGSTPLAERLDPEEFRDLLDEYFEIALAHINRLDGFTTQLAGDGIMALFGAPIAHEDAPQRAVHAALRIREALAELSERLKVERGVELQVRIGIHTGPVVVGTMGDDRTMNYTAVGDTTNLASRLETLARPGSILISEATLRLVRGFFLVEPAGPLDVRGKTDPVVAYEVIGLQEALAPMAVARARGLTPFVGRGQELAQLRACFDRLARNDAQVVAVVGEAGSGKSRLLYEFRQQLADQEVVFFEARCSALTQPVAFAPFVSMLRQHFGLSASQAGEEACQRVLEATRGCDMRLDEYGPYLCRLLALPGGAEVPDLPADEMRRRMFEAVAQLVTTLSERQPVVMLLEDLQWSDESSREMLDLALAHMRSARFMLVVSHRPEFETAWRTRASFTQLNLARLSDEETVQIVRSLAGGTLPARLEKKILVKAEGNPFFAEELTRTLMEEGFLVAVAGSVRVTKPIADIRLPDTIHEVIAARLDRLAGPAKRVVQVAALLGRQFNRRHIVALLSGNGVDVDAALAELEDRGVIHRKSLLSNDELRFGESLTQEVAYESMLLKDRRQLHERVGTLLEQSAEETGAERSAMIAHHLARSDDRERAVRWLLRAAEDAEKLPSYPVATRFYREGWEIAEAALAEGQDRWAAFAPFALQAVNGFCRMVVMYGSSDTPGNEQAAQRGRELAEALGEGEHAAGFSAYQGLILMSAERARFGEGLALVERGFHEAQDAGHALTAVLIARGLAIGYLNDGRFELSRQTFDWILSELQRAGETARISDFYLGARFNLELAQHVCRDVPASLESALQTQKLAVKAGNRTIQGATASLLGLLSLMSGNHNEARRWADQGLEIAEAIGNVASIRTTALVAMAARWELRELSSESRLRYLDLVEQGFAARGDMAWKSATVAEVLLDIGEVERARRFVDLARAHAGGRYREAACTVATADVSRHLGPGHFAEAEAQYRAAIEAATQMGAPHILAQAQLGLGALFVARGDAAAARDFLEGCLRTARGFGHGRLVRRVQQLLDAPSSSARAAAERH